MFLQDSPNPPIFRMCFPVITVLFGIFLRHSLGSSLEVIDQDNECVIWSNDNHGCTGYSESFAKLNGNDCSELHQSVHGDNPWLGICGQINGNWVAWVVINKADNRVNFNNLNNEWFSCILDDGLKTGSKCFDGVFTTSGSSEIATSSSTATSSSNAATSSTAATLSSDAATSSSTTTSSSNAATCSTAVTSSSDAATSSTAAALSSDAATSSTAVTLSSSGTSSSNAVTSFSNTASRGPFSQTSARDKGAQGACFHSKRRSLT